MSKLTLIFLAAPALWAQQAAPQLLPTNTTLEAFVGESTSIQFSCPACPTNTTYSYSGQGALPNGLTFSPTTRTISGVAGTPNQRQSFAIIATSGTATVASRSYSLTTDRRLNFLTDQILPAATAGIAVTRNVQVTLASAWDTGTRTLPTNITVSIPNNSATATLAGTFPSVSSPTTYSLQLYASYPPSSTSEFLPVIFQNINRVFSITVNPPPTLTANLPPAQVGIFYTAALTANGGTAPLAYAVTSQLPPGLTLNPSTGIISGTPQLNGTFPLQAQVRDANGATANTAVNLVVTGTPLQITSLTFPAGRVAQNYSAPLVVSGGTPPFAWSILPGTLPPPGITVSGASLAGLPNTIGISAFTIRVVDSLGVSAQANVSITINPALLTISTTNLPNATPNAPYQASLSATGGIAPYAWVLASGALPNGLTLGANGLISGTPTTSGVATFSVRVTDTTSPSIGYQGGAATQNLTITVGAGPLTISPLTLPIPIVGQAFAATATATGGTPPYTWGVSTGSLPPGLLFSPGGIFSGTPNAAGAVSFTIQVRDSAGAIATRDLTLAPIAGLAITTASLDDGAVGVPYNLTLAAQNGTAPFTYLVSAGALPAGLTLSSTGIISGTPLAAGTANVTFRVTDRGNLTATRTFDLVVRNALSILPNEPSAGNVGTAYSSQLTGDGGFPPYAYTVASGNLPPGLTLGSTGAITGTPTTAGSATVTFRVTDSRNFTATRIFTLVINQVSLPQVTVTQITDTTAPASQPTFGVSLSGPFPSAIDGTVSLAFQPEAGPADPDVKFANGATTMNFTIPAGQTNGVPGAGTPFSFASGTTAGTITLTVVLRSNGQTLSPNPAAVRTIRLNRAGPTITNVRINRTASGFEVLVTGFSNTREIASGNLRFNPAPGVTLATADFPLTVGPAFQTWFASAPSANFGTQFLLTIPFTVADGTAASLSTVLVTLTNAAGSGSALGNF